MMVQTEIGLLPEDWEVETLENIGSFTKGSGISRSDSLSGRIPAVRYGELYTDHDNYIKTFHSFISPEVAKTSRKMKQGCILFTASGETKEDIGKAVAFLDDFEAYAGGDLIILNPKGDYSSQYLGYTLNSPSSVRQKAMMAQGDSVVHITTGSVQKVTVPIPSSTEQQNIASALSSIDKLIDDLGRTIQKKQRIREGAMEELLSGKKRLPGFTEEWVEKKIGDIGKTYSGLTGKTKEDFGHGDAKYITFLNVLNNAILDISIFEAVDVRPNEKQNAAHYGDLFFNTSSETPEDVGTCACLNTEVPNLYLNSFCFGYRLNDEEVYGNFLAYFFRTKAGRDIMYSLAQGATRYNLSKEYFNEIKITMPPTIKEQQSISYVFEAMTDEISLLESERAKYEQIRSGMMEELLTGKKRLK